MALKYLFCFLIAISLSSIAQGQYWKERLPANRAKVAAKDVKKEKNKVDSAKAHEQFCKEEEQRTIIAMALAATRDQRQKALVPLAGQKSYFGAQKNFGSCRFKIENEIFDDG